MSDIEATKFYVRHREGYPETELQDFARRGFWTLGVETAPFSWVTDIDVMPDLGPTVGIAGYIGDVHRALRALVRPIPANVDYPEELRDFFGRAIEKTTVGAVRSMAQPVFVKPVEHKAFTGFVWQGCTNAESRRAIVTQPDETEVWVADVLDLKAEYRSFILRGEILDCRRYKGDWSYAPSRSIVEQAAERCWKAQGLAAFALDWAVTADGRTVLVEQNEGFALGHYGLHPVSYAKMLSARWAQMMGA